MCDESCDKRNLHKHVNQRLHFKHELTYIEYTKSVIVSIRQHQNSRELMQDILNRIQQKIVFYITKICVKSNVYQSKLYYEY